MKTSDQVLEQFQSRNEIAIAIVCGMLPLVVLMLSGLMA